MLAFKLAIKNLLNSGLKTWLNVFVLSLSYVLLVFYNGMIDGWDRQAQRDTQAWEIAEGQYWVPSYDRYDPFTLQEAHQEISSEIKILIASKELTPLLLREAVAYPKGRQQGVVLKGLAPDQELLKLPLNDLLNVPDPTSAVIIGQRMSHMMGLKAGERFLLRWRDANGAFDAKEMTIAAVFECDVPTIDAGQIYMDISTLQQMCSLPNEASILITGQAPPITLEGWNFQSPEVLMADIIAIIKSKKAGGFVMTFMLLLIALLAIFDTQVFSVFRRQKEIGTYIALGMTQRQVVRIFTFEGAANSIFAAILASIYSTPLFIYLAKNGIPFGEMAEGSGLTISQVVYPYYSMGLILTAILLVVISASIVSYLPSRKIAKINPTLAIRGKVS